MSNEYNDTVDTRVMKSGQIRLRFKLSEWATKILNCAFDLTDTKFNNTSLDYICMNFLSGFPTKVELGNQVNGNIRLLVRLYPDQYATIRLALTSARQFVGSDAEALILMCLYFIHIEANNNNCINKNMNLCIRMQ